MTFIPAKMGRLNKRALLGQLQKTGRASRAELAKSLGMSQPTAGKIVDDLLTRGVLEEVEAAANGHGARLGRPGRKLQLEGSKQRFLGVQLGLTETYVAGLSLGMSGEDNWQIHFPTPTGRGNIAEQWVRGLNAATAQFVRKDFWGVLVSLPGIVDEQANRMIFSPHLRWTAQADLPKLIQEIWKVPVLLVQEERALALGHQLANPHGEDFLLVDFGDGVGGAMIVQGRPYANPLPISGELGHTPVFGNRRSCGCGAVGCVETLVSTRGLLESFAAANPKQPPTWAAVIADVAARGVSPWLAPALAAVAGTIAGALNVLGLRRVVITGSLTELSPVVVDYLSQAITNGAMWARFGAVECVAAPRRRTAGLVTVGLDRFVVPDKEHNHFLPHKILRRNSGTVKQQA